MESLNLSISIVLIQWANFCVDWFMNFFADAEYYWVDESYPGSLLNKKEENKEQVRSIEPTTFKIEKSVLGQLKKTMFRFNFNPLKMEDYILIPFFNSFRYMANFCRVDKIANKLVQLQFLV